jgi:L-rhamnose isomerase
MASSVSAERAFSAAGITLTKRRNRLKGDIMEALQVVKSALRKDSMMQPPLPTSAFETALEAAGVTEEDLNDEVDNLLNKTLGDKAVLMVDLEEEAEDVGTDSFIELPEL